MTSPFSFEAPLVFGFLSIFLLLGVLVRAKVTIIQRYLFPSCLIGGVLGSIALIGDWLPITSDQLKFFAFHLFNISFISAGLTWEGSNGKNGEGTGGVVKGTVWMALTQGITFPMQAAIGGIIVLVLGLFGVELFDTFGFLAPLGFNEGPGQALSVGKVWEEVGFADATNIGLTFAGIGFLFAFFVGVPLANWGLRKGWSKNAGGELPREFKTGVFARSQQGESAGSLRLHPGNIDSLAYQAALIGMIYVITYIFTTLVGRPFSDDVAKMLWAFFFFFGFVFSIIIRLLIEKIGIGHLVNPGIQKRITGWSIDYLIVATIPAIQFAAVWKFALPIALISIINGFLTVVVVVFLGKRLWSENLERTVAIFGTVTGTVPSGLLLLRIVDYDFRTSVTFELAIMNLLMLPIVFGLMMLVNATIWWDWRLGLTILAFIAVACVSYALMRLLRLQGTPKY